MGTALPFRSRVRNVETRTAAPAALLLIASRHEGADASVLVLRGDLEGMTSDQAKRHAVDVLDALTHNEPGAGFSVELQDSGNVLLWCCSGGAL